MTRSSIDQRRMRDAYRGLASAPADTSLDALRRQREQLHDAVAAAQSLDDGTVEENEEGARAESALFAMLSEVDAKIREAETRG